MRLFSWRRSGSKAEPTPAPLQDSLSPERPSELLGRRAVTQSAHSLSGSVPIALILRAHADETNEKTDRAITPGGMSQEVEDLLHVKSHRLAGG